MGSLRRWLLLLVAVIPIRRAVVVTDGFSPCPRGGALRPSPATRTASKFAVGRARTKEPFRASRSDSLPLSATSAPTGVSAEYLSGLNRPATAAAEGGGQLFDESSEGEHREAVIVGGGPAGLLSAVMMAQRLPPAPGSTGPRIVVYDRLPPPPPPDALAYSTDVSKYYLLGLGHRGQTALRHFGVWNDVEKASVAVLGRRDWAPGKTREEDGNVRLVNKAVTSRVLARDKLVGVLKEVIERKYGGVVELRYGWQVDPISFGDEEGAGSENGEGGGPPVKLRVSRCIPIVTSSEEDPEECSIGGDDATPKTITTDFLIGSDGAARTIANAMEANDLERQKRSNPMKGLFSRGFRVTRYEDDNPRVYKSIPISFPPHWPHDLNYSARSTDSRATFEALPSDSRGNYCALLLLKPKDALAAANCDPNVLRDFFDEQFPQFSKLLEDEVISDVATKGASPLPGFRFAGPRLHEGGRTVLLGDCIHTVKPYFGLGANTALEDVRVLGDILSHLPSGTQNYGEAIRLFSKERAEDCKALVTISRGMDRPGRLGTIRFVLPLILDGIFHKLAPGVFAPGMFGMFQLEGIGFRRIQRRKRVDRTTQSLVVLVGVSTAGAGLGWLVRAAARMLGVRSAIVGRSLVGLVGAIGIARGIGAKMKKSQDNR